MADDTYTVQRSVHVAAPADRIYPQIADFRQWPNWSPWEGLDPALQRTYSGAPSGAGAAYAWSGNRKAGEGRMEITEATPSSSVRLDLQFVKPFRSRTDTVFTIAEDGAGSRVTWAMTGRKTLMTRVMGVFKSMDALLGPDFEKGLGKLKAVAESSRA